MQHPIIRGASQRGQHYGDAGAPQERLCDPFSSNRMHRCLSQLCATKHPPGTPRDAPGTCGQFLTVCWQWLQRLLGRVDLSVHCKTIFLAFPSNSVQARNKNLPGQLSNCCKYLHRARRTRAQRRLGKCYMAITSQIKAAAVPQPGPEHLSSQRGLTRPPATTAEARSTISNNSFS